MRRRLMVWTTVTAFLLATLPIPGSVAQAKDKATSQLAVPIAGTVDGVANALSGTFTITRFARSGGQLVAVGTLSATVSDATGNILRTIITPLAVPVAASAVPQTASVAAVAIAATCPILHLELGPLDLTLLGLVVHLDRVVLDITAQSGPGNLLGNLLCSIAGLLDPAGPLTQLINALNQLLDALSNL